MSNGLGDVFTRNTLFDLDPGVTHNITQHPLYHVTYALVTFEVAMSSGLVDVFTRKYII